MEFKRNLSLRDLGQDIKQLSKPVARLGIALTFAASLNASLPSSVHAAGVRTGGFYTNISGMEAGDYGVGAGSYNGDADCNIDLGYCIAQDKEGNPYIGGRVERYVCKTTELRPLIACDGDHNADLLVSSSESFVHYINEGGPSPDMKADHVIALVVRDGKGVIRGFMVYDTGLGDEAAFTCTGVMARSNLDALLESSEFGGSWEIDSEIAAYNKARCGDSSAKAPNPGALSPDQSNIQAVEYCSASGEVTSLEISGQTRSVSGNIWGEVINEKTGKREVFLYEGKLKSSTQLSITLPGDRVHSIRDVSSMEIDEYVPYKIVMFKAPETLNEIPSDSEATDEVLVQSCN